MRKTTAKTKFNEPKNEDEQLQKRTRSRSRARTPGTEENTELLRMLTRLPILCSGSLPESDAL